MWVTALDLVYLSGKIILSDSAHRERRRADIGI